MLLDYWSCWSFGGISNKRTHTLPKDQRRVLGGDLSQAPRWAWDLHQVLRLFFALRQRLGAEADGTLALLFFGGSEVWGLGLRVYMV